MTSNIVNDNGAVTTSIGTLGWHAQGKGKTLLFLHGLLTNSTTWEEVFEHLAQDFRCIAIDLPLGSHTYPAQDTAPLTVESMADAVSEAAHELCPQGFTLVGSDTGGVVAQLVASRLPAGLKNLILLSCDTEKNFLPLALRYLQVVAYIPGAMQALRFALRNPRIRRLPIAFGWLVNRELTEREWDSIVRPLDNPEVRRDLGKALRGISTRYTLQAARDLENFDLPTLFLWADTQKLFPIKNAYALAKRMPQARVVKVPQSLAFSQLDQPEYVAQAIKDELRTKE